MCVYPNYTPTPAHERPWDRQGNAGALRILNELLQVLHLLAKLLCQRKALPHLHKQSCYLVAAQEPCCSPLQAVQDTGLHSSCKRAKPSLQRLQSLELMSQQLPPTHQMDVEMFPKRKALLCSTSA